MACTNVTYIPLPRLPDGTYNLFNIDVCLRYEHEGLLNIYSIEWDEGLCYQVELPIFGYPFDRTVNVSKVFAAVRWLREVGVSLSSISEENLFLVGNDVVLYIGDTAVAKADNGTNDDISNEMSQEEKSLTSLLGKDPGSTLKGRIITNYDHLNLHFDTLSSSHRDKLKLLVNDVFKNYKTLTVGDYMSIIDLGQRCCLISEKESDIKKVMQVVPNIYFGVHRRELATEKSDLQKLIERTLLINFGGMFYNPWGSYVQDKKSFKKYIDYIVLCMNPYTYFLGEKSEGSLGYHATVKEAFSKDTISHPK
jgi:hypothetical protein